MSFNSDDPVLLQLLPTSTKEDSGGATTVSVLHADIIESHILGHLDGPTLASTSCASSALHSLISSCPHLWSHLCHATWPSTNHLRHLISTFPDDGPRTFFSLSYPLPTTTAPPLPSNHPPPSELISSVDIHYQNNLVFSKVQHTETLSGWFRCSPFRIDLLDPKDVVPTKIPHPASDDVRCTDIVKEMSLSWILIDPTQKKAVNLSSLKPVSAQRHWLTGEVQVRFVSVHQKSTSSELVECMIVVTAACGGGLSGPESGGGVMEVREVSMEVEDMDGVHLKGKESLVILRRAMEGKRENGKNWEEEGRRRYREYVQKRKERKERKVRTEWVLDLMCMVFAGMALFAAASWFFVLCR